MTKVTTFGEIMLRLSPVEKGERLHQAAIMRVEPGGSESNVAIALSNLGLSTQFVTKLPDNALTLKIIQHLSQFKVDTSSIVIQGEKLGVYWTENGTGPRNSFVIYDRENTSFSEMKVDDFNFKSILEDTQWFHFSGISPAISERVFLVLSDILEDISIPFSVDLNFRAKLWNWLNKSPERIREKMIHLCHKATLLAGNESDFQNVLGIHSKAELLDEAFSDIALQCFDKFPTLNYISISNREAVSASSNDWSGYLFIKNDATSRYKSIKYKLEPIEDRVGTGDSFVAGIIYGIIHKNKYSFQEIVDFATTLAALNHTTLGDASRFSAEEVWSVFENNGTGRILR